VSPRRLAIAWPLAALLLGASPFREEHPLSRQARERIASGAPERALESYAALEKELGPRPEIEVGRGAALLALGRGDEARQAFDRARDAPEPVGSRALLGLGDARAAKGDVPGAIAATREALVRDPGYEEARGNLEILLRRAEPEGGAPRPEADRPKPDASPGPGDRAAADAPPPGRPAPEPGAAPGRPGERQREPEEAGAAPGELSRAEAERLLDALRARERALPSAPPGPRSARRPDAEKDW
jgi:tetratricopeptide (TPR) repeat protein